MNTDCRELLRIGLCLITVAAVGLLASWLVLKIQRNPAPTDRLPATSTAAGR